MLVQDVETALAVGLGFDVAEAAVLASLPWRSLKFESSEAIVEPEMVILVLGGMVGRTRPTVRGPSIVSFHFLGDLLGLEGFVEGGPPLNLESLTKCRIGVTPWLAFDALTLTRATLGRELWRRSLKQHERGEHLRRQLTTLGAPGRLASVLCCLASGFDREGRTGIGIYSFPLTQIQLAEHTGLSAVHVNRVLRQLRSDGLIKLGRKRFVILDRPRLQALAGDDRYAQQVTQVRN